MRSFIRKAMPVLFIILSYKLHSQASNAKEVTTTIALQTQSRNTSEASSNKEECWITLDIPDVVDMPCDDDDDDYWCPKVGGE